MNKVKRVRQQTLREQKQAEAASKQALQKKGWLAAALVFAVLLGAAFVYSLSRGEIPDVDALVAADQVKGYDSAPMTLIEYSDFQCPACRAQQASFRSSWDKIRRDVKLVYRHFPLDMHAHAQLAAQYAEAAGKQNKFWEMHDLLFDKQAEWAPLDDPTTQFEAYATQLKLDLAQLKTDAGSDVVINKIKADVASGYKAKVNGTPTLFLDGKPLSNVRDAGMLVEAIQQEKTQK